jgi:hypothetical protein
MRRPDVEHAVVAEARADVEQEVVGVDEEVFTLGALGVVERRHRGEDQRAGPGRPARMAHDHPEPIPLGEVREDVVEDPRPALHPDRERRAGQLARGVHESRF